MSPSSDCCKAGYLMSWIMIATVKTLQNPSRLTSKHPSRNRSSTYNMCAYAVFNPEKDEHKLKPTRNTGKEQLAYMEHLVVVGNAWHLTVNFSILHRRFISDLPAFFRARLELAHVIFLAHSFVRTESRGLYFFYSLEKKSCYKKESRIRPTSWFVHKPLERVLLCFFYE